MRSISVSYFIKMKTGGIFYFVCRCFRHPITGPLLRAIQVKHEESFEKCSLHAESFSLCPHSQMSALCRSEGHTYFLRTP